MLNLHYDPVARQGLVRLRPGRAVRTRQLSEQATGEYDRSGRLLTIAISQLDATAAEFLRTGDEETLLRVIEQQAGATKAGTRRRPPPRKDEASKPAARPKAKPRPKAAGPKPAKPKPAAAPEGEAAAAAPKRRRRRRSRRPAGGSPEGTPATE